MNHKVKVAILDTGVDINHEYLSNSIIDGISFEKENNEYMIKKDYKDENGHGTACASVIKKECNDVEFFVIKILDKNAEGNLEILERGLKFLINTDIRLINMSLSIMDKSQCKSLKKICDELNRQNKIIVCSLTNKHKKSYPAFYKSVIGVRGIIFDEDISYWFNKHKNIQAIVNSKSYLHCSLNNTYSLFGECNSYAAAKMTGIIAKVLANSPEIEKSKLMRMLSQNSDKKWWNRYDLRRRDRYVDLKDDSVLYNEDVLSKLKKILVDFLNLKDSSILEEDILFSPSIGLDGKRCYELLKVLERNFNIKFKDYTNFCIDDFLSVYTLASLINDELKKNRICNYE